MTAEKKPRGRPLKPDALSNAERQANYRARQKARIAELEGLVRSGVLPPVIDRFEDSAALSALSALDRPAAVSTSRDRPQAAAATAGRGPGEDEGAQPRPLDAAPTA